MVDEMCLSEALLSGAKEVFETMIFMDLQECCEQDRLVGPCQTTCYARIAARAYRVEDLGPDADSIVRAAACRL